MQYSYHVANLFIHSECPEECKEAVSSLIYAAARFGDLPELRKLRSLLTERYGDSFEPFVNKEVISPKETLACILMLIRFN